MSEAFDQLAKMVAGGRTRRGVLKSIGGLLAGVFLAGFAGKARADDDEDEGELTKELNKACKDYCAGCPRKPGGVHGHCIERCKKFFLNNPTGKLCGTCTATQAFAGCATGASCCTPAGVNAFCTNTGTDVLNCGACGNVCPTTKPACCSGACTNTQTDNNNCGTCGTVCATGKTCKAGVCA